MSLASEFKPANDAHIRLVILKLLAAQAMGNANDAVVYEALNAMDLTCSREAVREHFFWMGGQNLVSVLDLRLNNGLVVATLTERGGDVAKGRSFVPGVERERAGG